MATPQITRIQSGSSALNRVQQQMQNKLNPFMQNAGKNGPWYAVGVSPQPPFLNGWANVPGSAGAAYSKDYLGYVNLRGSVSGSTASVIFVLPQNYWPPAPLTFSIDANGAHGSIGIDASGNVRVLSGATSNVSLSGIRFDTKGG